MLTDPGDLVVDPFAGSCATGEVCERLDRRWMCVEVVEEYLRGAIGRFERAAGRGAAAVAGRPGDHYRVPRPGLMWGRTPHEPLRPDGGRTRKMKNEK
jgi:site-specific DNA-methyltransferase (cytosine-N4-specific)